MDYRGFRIPALAVLFASLLISCSRQDNTPMPVRRARPPKKAAQEKVVKDEDQAAYMKMRVEGKYRNPFQSYIALSKGKAADRPRRGPLECCELSQFRLLAVVAGKESSYALVRAPDNKSYVIRRGDAVGLKGGRVVRIYRGGLTVREYIRDEDGKVVSSVDTEVTLPRAGSGKGAKR